MSGRTSLKMILPTLVSMNRLFGWYADGGLRPHVSHRLPLARAAEGLELLRSRQSTGKVVIETGLA